MVFKFYLSACASQNSKSSLWSIRLGGRSTFGYFGVCSQATHGDRGRGRISRTSAAAARSKHSRLSFRNSSQVIPGCAAAGAAEVGKTSPPTGATFSGTYGCGAACGRGGLKSNGYGAKRGGAAAAGPAVGAYRLFPYDFRT